MEAFLYPTLSHYFTIQYIMRFFKEFEELIGVEDGTKGGLKHIFK